MDMKVKCIDMWKPNPFFEALTVLLSMSNSCKGVFQCWIGLSTGLVIQGQD